MNFLCVSLRTFHLWGGLVFIMDDHDKFPNWIMIPNSMFPSWMMTLNSMFPSWRMIPIPPRGAGKEEEERETKTSELARGLPSCSGQDPKGGDLSPAFVCCRG